MNCLLILMVAGVYFSLAYNINADDAIQWRTPVSSCTAAGENIADTDNATIYYLCAFQYDNGTWLLFPMECSEGSYFNTTFSQCLLDDEMTTTVATTDVTEVSEETTTDVTDVSEETTTDVPEVGEETTTDVTEDPCEGTSPAETGSPIVTTTSPNPTDSSEGTSPAQTGSPVVTTIPPVDCTSAGGAGGLTANCTSAGRFADDTDCTKYFLCILNAGQWFRYRYECASGHYYNTENTLCSPGVCPYPMDPCLTTITTIMSTEATSTQASSSPTTIITSSTTTTSPTTTTSSTTTAATTPSVIGYTCLSEGKFPDPDPSACTKYYQCTFISGLWYYWIYECPPGSYFDPASVTCSVGTC